VCFGHHFYRLALPAVHQISETLGFVKVLKLKHLQICPFECQLVQTALRLDKRVYYVLAALTVLSLCHIGSRSSPIILFVFVICTGSLVYAVYLASWVLAKDEGPPEMSEVLLSTSIWV
jgi:hypothetical protein